jgi:hypothetical protein
MPNAELAVVPGTSHTLLSEKPDLCVRLVSDFLTTDPVPTLVPIRRAWERPGPRARRGPGPDPTAAAVVYRKRKIGGQLMMTPLDPNLPPLGPVMWPWAASPRMRNSSKLRER